jgi:hypothetical protein
LQNVLKKRWNPAAYFLSLRAQRHTRLHERNAILLVGTGKPKKADAKQSRADQAHHTSNSPFCSCVSITLSVAS